MRVRHLNAATLCPRIGGRAFGGEGSLLSSGHFVCHCLVIETAQGLVVVDTGIGSAAIQEPALLGRGFTWLTGPTLRQEETLVHQLRALALDPADVRHVVLTHLDPDHAGALSDFPKATVHLMEPEYRAARTPTAREVPRYRWELFRHGPLFRTHVPAGETWKGFSCVQRIEGLPPELLLVPLYGHTRGHCGVAVQADDGWLLHAGDAYFAREDLDGPPSLARALFERLDCVDDEQRLANLERLRALHRDGSVRVFCSHDARELAAFG